MKLGNLKALLFVFILSFANIPYVFSADKIESVPLINLEELSPTFEEDKDALEKIDEQKNVLQDLEKIDETMDVLIFVLFSSWKWIFFLNYKIVIP